MLILGGRREIETSGFLSGRCTLIDKKTGEEFSGFRDGAGNLYVTTGDIPRLTGLSAHARGRLLPFWEREGRIKHLTPEANRKANYWDIVILGELVKEFYDEIEIAND